MSLVGVPLGVSIIPSGIQVQFQEESGSSDSHESHLQPCGEVLAIQEE